jgi:hypothetical protein
MKNHKLLTVIILIAFVTIIEILVVFGSMFITNFPTKELQETLEISITPIFMICTYILTKKPEDNDE